MNATNQVIKISKLWNDSIEQKEEKAVIPRDRLWASELGKSDIDIYLKLLGEQPSNPFDTRAKRKFEAGNLFEWIVRLVLIRCGVYRESQKYVRNSEFGMDVSGKVDHLIGGIPNYDSVNIQDLMLPEMFTKAAESILTYFKENYPQGIPKQGIEVKSTSSFGIEKVYATGKALAGHDLQAFHYAYNLKIPFTVLYICRDDLRMAEIPIDPNDKKLLEQYSTKISKIAKSYNEKIEPEKEQPILFDKETNRFSKNFNVEYSPYLKKLYGFDTPELFDEAFGSKVESWNRVITRIQDKKELTENNKEKLSQMAEYGIDIISLLEIKY